MLSSIHIPGPHGDPDPFVGYELRLTLCHGLQDPWRHWGRRGRKRHRVAIFLCVPNLQVVEGLPARDGGHRAWGRALSAPLRGRTKGQTPQPLARIHRPPLQQSQGTGSGNMSPAGMTAALSTGPHQGARHRSGSEGTVQGGFSETRRHCLSNSPLTTPAQILPALRPAEGFLTESCVHPPARQPQYLQFRKL